MLFDRIVLCSGHRAPFVTYSVLKYHKENQEAGQEGMRYYVMQVSLPKGSLSLKMMPVVV